MPYPRLQFLDDDANYKDFKGSVSIRFLTLILRSLWDTMYPTKKTQWLSKRGLENGDSRCSRFCAKSQRLLARAVFSTADGDGLSFKIFQVQEKKRFSVISVFSRFYKSNAPIWAIVLFIKRSCFASDSASEQLGVSSSCSEVCIAVLYSSIIDGIVKTVLNFLEIGCSIFPMVEYSLS